MTVPGLLGGRLAAVIGSQHLTEVAKSAKPMTNVRTVIERELIQAPGKPKPVTSVAACTCFSACARGSLATL